jgi:hypothetical protein
MSADLDNYRDLRDRERDRERDRDRDRSMLMRDDRYMNPRGRERDRYGEKKTLRTFDYLDKITKNKKSVI